VEAAEGGDREIDRAVWDWFDTQLPDYPNIEARHWDLDYPKVTASLDSVLSLVEERLPEWRWAVNKSGWAELHWLGGPQPEKKPHAHPYVSVHDAATPALAMLSALLRALEAKQRARPARGDR
jgi:hypothetical protein